MYRYKQEETRRQTEERNRHRWKT